MASTVDAIRAIESALKELDAHKGEAGYRKDYDRATHILIALDRAGLKVVKAPKVPS